MVRLTSNRTYIVQALAALCVVLVFAMGMAQAVHSHPDNSQTSHHSCSICSAPSLGPATTTVSVLPMVRPVAAAHLAEETFVVFRPASTNFVRPPPAV